MTEKQQTKVPPKLPPLKKRGRGRPPLNHGGGDSGTHNIRFANMAWRRLRSIARRRKQATADLVRQAADDLIERDEQERRNTKRGDA